jgi:hypothetical protein
MPDLIVKALLRTQRTDLSGKTREGEGGGELRARYPTTRQCQGPERDCALPAALATRTDRQRLTRARRAQSEPVLSRTVLLPCAKREVARDRPRCRRQHRPRAQHRSLALGAPNVPPALVPSCWSKRVSASFRQASWVARASSEDCLSHPSSRQQHSRRVAPLIVPRVPASTFPHPLPHPHDTCGTPRDAPTPTAHLLKSGPGGDPGGSRLADTAGG